MKNTQKQAGNAAVISVVVVAVVVVAGFFIWRYSSNESAEYTATPTAKASPSVSVTATPSVSATPTPTPTATVSAVKSFTVIGAAFSFVPNKITVKKGDTVKITFHNTEGNHDWVIDEFNARTNVIGAGKEQTIQFVADKTGSFEFYCSVGTHRQMGMKGTLTVQ